MFAGPFLPREETRLRFLARNREESFLFVETLRVELIVAPLRVSFDPFEVIFNLRITILMKRNSFFEGTIWKILALYMFEIISNLSVTTLMKWNSFFEGRFRQCWNYFQFENFEKLYGTYNNNSFLRGQIGRFQQCWNYFQFENFEKL